MIRLTWFTDFWPYVHQMLVPRICQENLTSGKLRVKFNYIILYGYFYYISVNCIHITYICITLTGGTFSRARAYASSVYCLQRFEASKHTPRWARPCQDIRLRVGLWFFKKEATCISVSTWCCLVITFLFIFRVIIRIFHSVLLLDLIVIEHVSNG